MARSGSLYSAMELKILLLCVGSWPWHVLAPVFAMPVHHMIGFCIMHSYDARKALQKNGIQLCSGVIIGVKHIDPAADSSWMIGSLESIKEASWSPCLRNHLS
uniref:RRM Nup35-type domain-containing protein n=1 Tax=Aegilops tauschii subsp. strangulata TaxID=200361 RepID=A0A453JUB5_AEGTS